LGIFSNRNLQSGWIVLVKWGLDPVIGSREELGGGFSGEGGLVVGMEGATVVQELNGVFFRESEISEWHG